MMLRSLIACSALACATLLHAADAPAASEASIRELLDITESRKLLDSVFPQFEALMHTSMKQALGDRTLSAEEEKTMQRMTTRMLDTMREELSWEQLEPLYIQIYRQSFTQEELNGILEFYKSPAGQAMTRKMPVVMKNSMTAMQERMQPMMARIQKAVEETVQEIEADKAAPKTEARPAPVQNPVVPFDA